MPHPNQIKYQGVPDDVSRIAANACWSFIEELDALSSELEGIGQVVANVRYSSNPTEWQHRLNEGADRLVSVSPTVELLARLIRIMGEHLPTPNNPENDPSNWVGGREFDPEFDMGCDGDCGTTGEKEAAGSWFMDPKTQLIYCRECALKRGLFTP